MRCTRTTTAFGGKRRLGRRRPPATRGTSARSAVPVAPPIRPRSPVPRSADELGRGFPLGPSWSRVRSRVLGYRRSACLAARPGSRGPRANPRAPGGRAICRRGREGATRGDVTGGEEMATPLSRDLLHRMDAYWRAANHLSVGQIYLYDNPLLRTPLSPAHVKPRLLGHWGTTPGQNFIYVHLNRVVREHA